ncbi:MAG: efflux RND transporter periplasmic adaptor subunit [Cyanobacteria bacterium K_Offshore_surface_m2_239]|nr:efflux RND transporter periplasmic adaptor subunit [Cyanobacteria bacterium K_Offshore_surface_m2_239]
MAVSWIHPGHGPIVQPSRSPVLDRPPFPSPRGALLASPVALALLPLALTACGSPKPAAVAPTPVRLVSVRALPFLDAIDVQSTLEAIREVKLAPEIAGRIVAMPMAEGQPVRPGQPLFALDQIQLRAEVNADAAEARKDRVNAERYIFLNQQGAVSTKERDFYVTQAIQSRDTLRANLANLGYKNVLSPIGGVVGNINYKLGDVVQAGSVVTSIVDNSRLWVRLDIPGEDAYRVRPGLPVVLKAPDAPGRLLARGAVSFIAPSIDKEKQTLLVKATFDNADGALRNGQRVKATLVYSQAPSLAVPQQAVLLQAGQPFVYVAVSPEVASQRLGRKLDPAPPPGTPVALQVPVTLGTLQRGAFAVRGGLNAGDQVILGNLFQLRSGLPVRPGTAPETRR